MYAAVQLTRLLNCHVICNVVLNVVHVALHSPHKCPAVRATLGNRSGPMTMRATSRMTASSENAISNMRVRLVFRLGFRWRFIFDGLPDLPNLIGFIVAHAFLETFHCGAQIAADVAQLLGTKYQRNN